MIVYPLATALPTNRPDGSSYKHILEVGGYTGQPAQTMLAAIKSGTVLPRDPTIKVANAYASMSAALKAAILRWVRAGIGVNDSNSIVTTALELAKGTTALTDFVSGSGPLLKTRTDGLLSLDFYNAGAIAESAALQQSSVSFSPATGFSFAMIAKATGAVAGYNQFLYQRSTVNNSGALFGSIYRTTASKLAIRGRRSASDTDLIITSSADLPTTDTIIIGTVNPATGYFTAYTAAATGTATQLDQLSGVTTGAWSTAGSLALGNTIGATTSTSNRFRGEIMDFMELDCVLDDSSTASTALRNEIVTLMQTELAGN